MNKNKKSSNTKKKRCFITLHDLILAKLLAEKFFCLQVGTIASKAQIFAEILLVLQPPFISTQDFPSKIEKLEFLRAKGKRLFLGEQTIEQRLRNKISENPVKVKEAVQLVTRFLQGNESYLKKDGIFAKYLVWENKEVKDLLRDKYLNGFNKQVYSFDTTRICKGCELTLVTDNASRFIVTYIITEKPPTLNHLIEMFNNYFTPELKDRCFIVHCDRYGSNMSTEFWKFFAEMEVALSFTTEHHKNQVAECNNKLIKDTLVNYKIIIYPDETLFEDYPAEDQEFLIKHAIEVFNNACTSINFFLPGHYSRSFIDATKEFLRSVRPDVVDKWLIFAKSKTKKEIL